MFGSGYIVSSIPDEDHVARYCKPSHAPNGEIEAGAFAPRESEDYLSTNWLEYFSHSGQEEQIDEVRKAFKNKGFQVKKKGLFAVLNVGATKLNIPKLAVVHKPNFNDPSHSGIYYDRDDVELNAELIRQTITDKYPAQKPED